MNTPTLASRSLPIAIALLMVGLPSLANAKGAKADPAALMQKSEDLHRLPAERQISVMVLQSKAGAKRTLQYETWTVQDKKAGDKLRIEFAEPADVRGTQLLTVEDVAVKDDDQWLYLPAFRKTRRIGKADLGDRFVGSDIYFEDMKRRYVSDYSYKMLGSEKVDGQDCYVIESVPKSGKVKKESPYGKSHIWLRKDILLGVKWRHFDRKLKPLKEVQVSDVKRVKGKAWRPNRVEIQDIQRKHRTIIIVKTRENAPALREGMFSKHRLGKK